jgi:hypothetical protein
MRLTTEKAHALLERHGCYVSEVCDNCGQILGAVRYTRVGESGVWCTRECRDGKEAHVPRTCKACGARLPEGKRRGTAYCDAACKQSAHRSKPIPQAPRPAKLSVTKPSIYAAFGTEKSRDGISGHPEVFSSPREEMAQG